MKNKTNLQVRKHNLGCNSKQTNLLQMHSQFSFPLMMVFPSWPGLTSLSAQAALFADHSDGLLILSKKKDLLGFCCCYSLFAFFSPDMTSLHCPGWSHYSGLNLLSLPLEAHTNGPSPRICFSMDESLKLSLHTHGALEARRCTKFI